MSRCDSDAVNSPPIFFSYCLDPDLTPSCVNLLMAITCNFLLTALVTSSCVKSQKHSGASRYTFYPPLCHNVTPPHAICDTVRYYFQLDLETLRFLHFSLQKRPKCFLFQISSPKYLKWQKERFRAIFNQIISTLGLNDPLKAVQFSSHQ